MHLKKLVASFAVFAQMEICTSNELGYISTTVYTTFLNYRKCVGPQKPRPICQTPPTFSKGGFRKNLQVLYARKLAYVVL